MVLWVLRPTAPQAPPLRQSYLSRAAQRQWRPFRNMKVDKHQRTEAGACRPQVDTDQRPCWSNLVVESQIVALTAGRSVMYRLRQLRTPMKRKCEQDVGPPP